MDPHLIATLGGDAMIEPAEFQIRMVLRSVEYQYDAIGRGKRLRRCEGLLLADVRVAADDPPRVLPERDAVVLKHRFRQALGLT